MLTSIAAVLLHSNCSLPSDLRNTHKTSLEGKTPSVDLRSARNCAVTWISASPRRGAGKKQPRVECRRRREKNMTPKQYLVFILSGLCADVIKGELSSGCFWADGRGGCRNCKDDMEARHTCVQVLVTKRGRGIPVGITFACAPVVATDRLDAAVRGGCAGMREVAFKAGCGCTSFCIRAT